MSTTDSEFRVNLTLYRRNALEAPVIDFLSVHAVNEAAGTGKPGRGKKREVVGVLLSLAVQACERGDPAFRPLLDWLGLPVMQQSAFAAQAQVATAAPVTAQETAPAPSVERPVKRGSVTRLADSSGPAIVDISDDSGPVRLTATPAPVSARSMFGFEG